MSRLYGKLTNKEPTAQERREQLAYNKGIEYGRAMERSIRNRIVNRATQRLWDAVWSGIDMKTYTVSVRYLKFIEGDFRLNVRGE